MRRFHVFIATTQGLVKIVGIEKLSSVERSVVMHTKAGNLSSISHLYHDFVQAESGLVQEFFGKSQYRLMLSANIDQGESWQLPVYIAHRLFAADRLSFGAIEPSDEIILATGKIDVISHNILPIQHLTKKTYRASLELTKLDIAVANQIFFIPSENYRQPIPDINFAMTPLGNVLELEGCLAKLGLPAVKQTRMSTHLEVRDKNNLGGVEILAIKKNAYSKKLLFSILAMATATILLLLVFNKRPSLMIEKRVGLNACVNPQINSVEFRATDLLELPAVFMHGLCSLEFKLSNKIKAVELLTDDNIRLSLTKNHQRYWRLPVPTMKSNPKNYILLLSIQSLNAADLQTLDQLSDNSNNLIELESNIKRWAANEDYEIIILKQRLL